MIAFIGRIGTTAYEQALRLRVEPMTVPADGSAEFLFRGEKHITVQ